MLAILRIVLSALLAMKVAAGFYGAPNDQVEHCKIAILGSGFAGSYAAYKLAPTYGNTLCVIERLSRDGGRVYDVQPFVGAPTYGTGPLRVTSHQKTMISLAKELGIVLEAEKDSEYLKIRGKYFHRTAEMETSDQIREVDVCRQWFTNVTCDFSAQNITGDPSSAMVRYVLQNHANISDRVKNHPDLRSYLMEMLGDEGYAFLKSATRLNSNLSPVSAQSMLDHLAADEGAISAHTVLLYPVGGMSQFITRMLAIAQSHGVRFYRNHAVTHISAYNLWDPNCKIYVTTNQRTFVADQVFSSIDPTSLSNVGGNIVDAVKAAPEFQSILPIPVAVVTAWWGERWWERVSGAPFSRAISHENCFNTMEIPTYQYGIQQNVTRAVYDDGTCLSTWRLLIGDQNPNEVVAKPVFNVATDKLAKQVVSSLQNVFPNLAVPPPKYIHGVIHNSAWHFQKPTSTISNARVLEWSQRPLQGKNVVLIGEAFSLNHASWCDGALKSVMWALTWFHGFSFPCEYDVGSPARCPPTKH